MKQSSYLIELVALFSKDTSLHKEIEQAIKTPNAYIQEHQATLAARGITGPIGELPWIALVDGLANRGLLHELDWKDDPQEAITVVLELAKSRNDYSAIAQSLNNVEPLLNDDIEEFLPTLNATLKPCNIQLVWLDINSDSYPLALLELKNLVNAKEYALHAGYGTIK